MWGQTYRNVTQDSQQDVDEEVGIASALEDNTERWEDDGEDDLDDVAAGKSQLGAWKLEGARHGLAS